MIASFTYTTVTFWCELFGYSRQAYYKSLHRQQYLLLREEVVVQLVKNKRNKTGFKRCGTRKLYHVLRQDFIAAGFEIGRDQLHRILLDNGLTIKIKRRGTRTTISHYWYRKWPDLRQDLMALASELLWCADITYLRLADGFCYLSLITDEYSRQIMGWCCHESLHTEGCLSALEMALANRKYPERKLVHHSDRGCQYCSTEYTDRLQRDFISISVTQSGSPYDNPMAESVNGQLKVELGLDETFADYATAYAACSQAILAYNTVRPHGSIDYLTPSEAHQLEGPINVRWKPVGEQSVSTAARTAEMAVNLLQVETNYVNYPPAGDF
ncbi:MAG: IS3 family transposase [Bacteroidota bacterium]